MLEVECDHEVVSDWGGGLRNSGGVIVLRVWA